MPRGKRSTSRGRITSKQACCCSRIDSPSSLFMDSIMSRTAIIDVVFKRGHKSPRSVSAPIFTLQHAAREIKAWRPHLSLHVCNVDHAGISPSRVSPDPSNQLPEVHSIETSDTGDQGMETTPLSPRAQDPVTTPYVLVELVVDLALPTSPPDT